MENCGTKSESVATIRCIYCKEVKPRPRRGEHVILEGLGGRTTIQHVCRECNGFLGRYVDEEFLRRSLVALRRLLDPEIQEGEASAPQFARTEVGYLDVRLPNSGHPDLLPQVLLEGDRVRICAIDFDQPLMERVLREVQEAGRACLHVVVRDTLEHEPARLVVNRKGKKHLVRARDAAQVERLLGLIEKTRPSGEYQNWDLNPHVHLLLSMDVNAPGRCAAKMALNAATYALGPDVVLGPDYDPVRNFVLGTDVVEGPVTASDGEEGLLLDTRFVDDSGVNAPMRGHPTWHTINLGVVRGGLCSRVSLFGGAERYWVRLGPAPSSRMDRLPIAVTILTVGEVWLMPNQGRLWWHHEDPMWVATGIAAEGSEEKSTCPVGESTSTRTP